MNKQTAKELGTKAYENGEPQTPALNAELMNSLTGSDNVEILKAYVEGWHRAADQDLAAIAGK